MIQMMSRMKTPFNWRVFYQTENKKTDDETCSIPFHTRVEQTEQLLK